MTTRAELNAIEARLLERVLSLYPHLSEFFVRAVVDWRKQNPGVRDLPAKIALREIFTIVVGVDPLTRPDFIDWIRNSVQPSDDDPLFGAVGLADAFHPDDVEVTP